MIVTQEVIKEFEKQMQAIYDEFNCDPEVCHVEMDKVMCRFLKFLGFGAGVEIFNSSDKWYA